MQVADDGDHRGADGPKAEGEVSEWNVVFRNLRLLRCRWFLGRWRLRHRLLALAEHLDEARDRLGRVALVTVAVGPVAGL